MQFAFTWQQVMDNSKTLTSRIVKPGEYTASSEAGLYIPDINEYTRKYGDLWDLNNPYRQRYYGPYVASKGGRMKWQVNARYSVQPGRTAKGIGFIQLLAIRRYDVRDITAEEARREGFQSEGDFWFTWITMHDKRWLETFHYAHDCDYMHEYGFYKRPVERYQAWQLAFKLVPPASGNAQEGA